ncbi:MAG TPA: DUF488 family protein [Thermomicrobiales bacterium]|nr:DUF488 family protein [Thermomicrobiales bacterium]
MDEQGGDAACWAAQFDDPMTTRVTVRGLAAAADAAGRRVLVDPVAPADRDDYDLWLPEIAPSPSLAHGLDERPDRWDQFRADYARELGATERAAALATLERLARQAPLTLMTAAPEPSRSAAEVARAVLTARLGDRQS